MPTMRASYQQNAYGYAPAGAAGATRKPGEVDPDDPSGAGYFNAGFDGSKLPGFVGDHRDQIAAGLTAARNAAAVKQGGTPTGGGGSFKAGYQPYYDPNNPAHQFSADGKADLGAGNGANEANLWAQEQQSMLDLNGQTQARRATAAGDRSAADAAAANMPGYYQAPTMPGAYQAPAAWQAPGAMPGPYAQTATRNGLPSTGDIAGDTSTLAASLRGASGGAPVHAGAVSGQGDAFQKAARGATGSMLAALKAQLATGQDTAAGRGRASSGYFDQDTGTVARNLAGDATNTILGAALQGAQLDQGASEANASNGLAADEYNSGQGAQFALAGLNTAAGTAMQRAGLDQSDFSTDQQFGLNAQNQNYGQAADQRNFSRSSYDDDRNFGSAQQQTDYGQAADQRNFGSAQQQTNYGQAADQRNYQTGLYQYDNGEADQSEGQYLGQLNYNQGNILNRDQQAAASKGGGIGGVLGGVAGTLLGSALGPVGSAIGGKLGSAIGGGIGGGGGGGGGQSSPYNFSSGIPGFSPDMGGASDPEEEDDYSSMYGGGTYGNNSYGYGGY